MKVAVVHSFYSSTHPSGENAVVGMQVDALRGAGFDVRLLAKYTDCEQRRPLYSLRAAANAMNLPGPSPERELREFNPDVIHVHNQFPNWATRWLGRSTVPIVVTLHNYRLVCANGLLWRDGGVCTECPDRGSLSGLRHGCYRNSAIATFPLSVATRGGGSRSPLLRHAAAVVALNDPAREFFAIRSRGAVVTIPNFAEDFGPGLPSRVGWLYVGRLTPEKGIAGLVTQFPREAQLTVIGDGPLAGEVRGLAEASGGAVRFLGRGSREVVAAAMRAARGLIVPSLWSEGIPTVALEAISAGTPLLLSDRIAAAGLFVKAGAAVTYDPRDDWTLREAIKSVEGNQSGFGSQARAAYEDRFSSDAWVRSVRILYESVL